jgi:hypothetical protein
MTISIDTTQLNTNVKSITRASVDDYAQLIRSVVNAVGVAIAFFMALAATARAAYRHPLAALDLWTKPRVVAAVAAPVKAPPTKKTPSPRPTTPAVSVISEKPVTASTPKC